MVTVSSSQRGFSLVEVLVAVVLLSIGLLGLAKLQFWGVRHTGSAYFRTQATQIANEMVERMRANPVGVAAGYYALNVNSCGTVDCSVAWDNCRIETCGDPARLARFDLYEMACGSKDPTVHAGVADRLPAGGLKVACEIPSPSARQRCTVEVCWSEADADAGSPKPAVMLEMTP